MDNSHSELNLLTLLRRAEEEANESDARLTRLER